MSPAIAHTLLNMDLPQPAPPADPAAQARADRARFVHALLASAAFVALLWWIKLLEAWLGAFSALALRPGEAVGLVGILTAPLLHGSVAHLTANTLPLLVLGWLALSVYPKAALRALPLIWLLSGALVWWVGRPPAHLGASGLTHGLMFFVFLLGLLRRDRPAIAAGMIAFFLYGGMLLTVLPREPGVSWEYHLFGALAGVLAAVLWRRLDPATPRRRYSWEDEDGDTGDGGPPSEASQYEPPPPRDVPVLWQRPPESRGVVLRFPDRRADGESQGPGT